MERLAVALDGALQSCNASYQAARQGGLPPCSVAWLEEQTHLLYRDVQRYRQKIAPDQILPTHFLDAPEKVRWFCQTKILINDKPYLP